MEPLLEIKNYERKSRLFLCGIDVSTACFHIDYSSHNTRTEGLSGVIKLELEIPELIKDLANAPLHERKRAADTFKKYLQLYPGPEIPD